MQKVAHNLNLFENHPQWPHVLEVCKMISQQNFETYLAGGCVRDLVMQNPPKDFDIATNATPDQLAEIFPKALNVGREFGVIILAFENFQIEIATFRSDGDYQDGRRPNAVHFTTAEQDALRRDFTVNALFLDLKTLEIIDYVGGLKDIENKILKAVGDPLKRFGEDKLRMMRALRFSAQLNFAIEPLTYAAIKNLHRDIRMVSPERIRDELLKLFQSKAISVGLTGLYDTGLLFCLHPQFAEFLQDENLQKLLLIYSQDLKQLQLQTKLCVFFAPRVAKNQREEFEKLKLLLRDLRFSALEAKQILWVLKQYCELHDFNTLRLADQIRVVAAADFSVLREFVMLYDPAIFQKLDSLFENLSLKYLVQGALAPAFLSGEDLKALGIKPGRIMGEILRETYDQQLEKKLNTREQALGFARDLVLSKTEF